MTVWWAMSLVIAVAAALLERSGKVRAASAAGKFAPAFMRRLALAAVGLQLLTAPLATASTVAVAIRKGTSAVDPPCSRRGRPPPPPRRPAHGHRRRLRPRRLRPRLALRPARRPLPIRSGGRSARSSNPARWRARRVRLQQPAGRGVEVTVRIRGFAVEPVRGPAGAVASDVDIALDWPRLYQANRDVIGANPHLLRPGQVLRASARDPAVRKPSARPVDHRDPHQPASQQQRKPHERHAPPPRRRGTPPVHVLAVCVWSRQRSSGRPRGHSFGPPPPLRVADEAREICAISRSTVQAAIEVLAGTRPAQQLARRLDERCLAALQHRAALTRRVAVRGVANGGTAAPQPLRPLGPGLPGIGGRL